MYTILFATMYRNRQTLKLIKESSILTAEICTNNRLAYYYQSERKNYMKFHCMSALIKTARKNYMKFHCLSRPAKIHISMLSAIKKSVVFDTSLQKSNF